MTSDNDVEVFDKISILPDAPMIYKAMDDWKQNHGQDDRHIIVTIDKNVNRYFLINNNAIPHNDVGDRLTMFESGDIFNIMTDIDKKWPEREEQEPFLHPTINEEPLKNPQQIKQEDKDWTYTSKPKKKINWIKVFFICLIVAFFVYSIIGGIQRLN